MSQGKTGGTQSSWQQNWSANTYCSYFERWLMLICRGASFGNCDPRNTGGRGGSDQGLRKFEQHCASHYSGVDVCRRINTTTVLPGLQADIIHLRQILLWILSFVSAAKWASIFLFNHVKRHQGLAVKPIYFTHASISAPQRVHVNSRYKSG